MPLIQVWVPQETMWKLEWISQARYMKIDSLCSAAIEEACLSEVPKKFAFESNNCPDHVASQDNPKVCGRCGIHIDSFRPDDEDPR